MAWTCSRILRGLIACTLVTSLAQYVSTSVSATPGEAVASSTVTENTVASTDLDTVAPGDQDASTYSTTSDGSTTPVTPTDYSTIITTTDEACGVPDNISNITVVGSNTTWLQVKWDVPSDNPTCVVNYTVCWQDVSTEHSTQCSYSEVTNYTIHGLQPCSSYNVSVNAEGSGGTSSRVYELSSTNDDVPGSILNLVVQSNYMSVDVFWTRPSVNTACTRSYQICWHADSLRYGSVNSNYNCIVTKDEQLSINDLLPCTQYHVMVAAVGPSQSSGNETATTKTHALVPGNIPDTVVVDIGNISLQFKWDEPIDNPSCVINYTVCWQDASSKSPERCSYSEVTNYVIYGLQPCSTYHVSIKAEGSEGSSSPVRVQSQLHEVAPGPPWNFTYMNVGVRNATMAWQEPELNAQCVAQYSLSWTSTGVHDTSFTNNTSYTMTNLQPLSAYNVTLAAVTRRNLTSPTIYIIVVTEGEPHNTSAVVAVTVTSLILLCGITACTIYMYRKGILVWPPWAKSPLRRKSLTHREISIKDFRSYCDQLLSTPARLQSEYQLLITLCADFSATMASTVGHLPDNKKKNRYVNVIPYDATRVKLDTNNKGVSDYINASYIKGYGGGVEYIAAQGPKEETCEDFWNMVLQQNVPLIIMLTQFEENNKVKCFRYFPGLRGNVKFGDVTVHCATEMMFPIYTQRTFTIYKDGRKKTVKHLHFREWPDFGCPDSTEVMLEFVQVGRQNTESRECPTVVHCSAGVGRTGTYIAVDILLQHIRENKKLDIYNTVYKLRQHRINMVQSEAQYIYIYQCIRGALDDEAIMNTEKSSSSHSLEPIYENINLTLNGSSYEKLAKGSKKVTKHNNNFSHL